jgi:hypothetical protein
MSETKDTNPKDAIATNKLPLHLVSPIVKAYQAIAHFLGNVKYGAWNYRAAGARASIYRSALDRHVDAWWEGEEIDPVDGTPHLANALCCLNILIEAKHSGGLIDDRPPSRSPELAKLRASFEALMPQIRARYADKNPHHYTIADTPAQAAEDAAANDDGWIRWGGYGRPAVEPERLVTAKRIDGSEMRGPAGWMQWSSVVEYRVEAA